LRRSHDVAALNSDDLTGADLLGREESASRYATTDALMRFRTNPR
jgi:hypothetical protein